MNRDRTKMNMGNMINYIKSRIILRNLVLAFFILIFGITFIMQILKVYTRHNHDIAVPDLAGLSLTDAMAAARERDMTAEVFDSVFLADFEKGSVVEQHPKAGRKVKKDRTIFLTMNAINPEKLAMPNLVDLTFRQASAKIESFGLKVGHITYEPDLAINVVLAQRMRGAPLQPGDTVVKGSAVDLVLGKGLSDERTGIPNLVGLSLEQAKITASDRFLSLGAAVRDQSVVNGEDEMKAVVFRQKPEAGSGIMLPLGSAIDVWITLDSARIPGRISIQDTTALN